MDWGLVGIGAVVTAFAGIAAVCMHREYREGHAARRRRKVRLLPRV